MAYLQLPLISAAHVFGNKPTTKTCSSNLQNILNHQKSRPRPHALKNKYLSCRGAKESSKGEQEDGNNVERGKFDRRDILLGLGGLYGTSAAVSPYALARPVEATNCGTAEDLPNNIKDDNCCPPAPPTPDIIDYQLPLVNKSMRVRPAAHLADKDYIAKYNKALGIMRSLPKDHPHSFAQQAAIHCAYCDFAYEMVDFPVKLDVHFSWLFFPFHRWYLYFFEKILGKLICEPDFAIPYWNWDSPSGMPMPLMFTNPNSPLYDELRNDNHYPPLPVDLNYGKFVVGIPEDADANLITNNLFIMYKQMVYNSETAEQFFGGSYRGGEEVRPPGEDRVKKMGSIENTPHTDVHMWIGDPNQPNQEDMGRFYSAGRDPIFYAHHANVDRMWVIWKEMSVKHKDIKDTDWLDSAFLLYDENERLVRVRIRDCLDTDKMGYGYQDTCLPWRHLIVAKPLPLPLPLPTQVFPIGSDEFFPKVLDDLLKFIVPRPKKSRTKEEKENQEEMLVIDGIEIDGDEYIKFHVYINSNDDLGSGPGYADFAGVFTNMPSSNKGKVKATQFFGLTKLLEDLEADDDDNVVVGLVPKTGKGKVTIGSAKIVLSS